MTVTQQQSPNTLRLTSDPTGTIPSGTTVQLVTTPSSGNFFVGFYEIELLILHNQQTVFGMSHSFQY